MENLTLRRIAELPSWTLSDATKIPMNPHFVGHYPPVYGVSNYDELKTYYEVVPHIAKYTNDPRPAFWIQKQDQLLFVDIEPEGAIMKGNPYLNWPFLYLERSRRGGYHGIVPLKIAEDDETFGYLLKKSVIKDPEWATEFFIQRHFITFTLNVVDELQTYKARNQIPNLSSKEFEDITYGNDFQVQVQETLAKLAPNVNSTLNFETNDAFKHFLNTNNTRQERDVLTAITHPDSRHHIPPLSPNDGEYLSDRSKAEYIYTLRLAGKIRFLLGYDKGGITQDQIDQIVKLTFKLTKDYLPPRSKLDTHFNHSQYGYLSYRLYHVLRAVDYIVSND